MARSLWFHWLCQSDSSPSIFRRSMITQGPYICVISSAEVEAAPVPKEVSKLVKSVSLGRSESASAKYIC